MCKRLYIFCITIRFDYIAEFPLSFDEHLLYLCIMSNVIADMFRAALNFLLHQEGRGAQVRLAVAQNIDRGYLNAVIKGRKPAAEEIRLKIANHFGMTYEAMLILGRAVEEGVLSQDTENSKSWIARKSQIFLQIKADQVANDISLKALQQATEILTSETEYCAVLVEIISTLHKTLKNRRETGGGTERLKLLEARLEKLEKATK
jgi:plasmid maintenance system antidote protein VapI